MRFAQTHVWPALRNFDIIAPVTALSRSASSNTSKGALPPSSRLIFLTESALWRIRMRPTSVEPVKVILRMRSSAHMVSPIAGASMPVRMFMMPAGRPARSASSASASAESGVCSAGFSTQAHPAAMPGATLRVIMAIGKFHGVIAPKTPIGCLKVSSRLSACGVSSTSPQTRRASSANQSMKLAP